MLTTHPYFVAHILTESVDIFFNYKVYSLNTLSSSEIISCKECGQHFDTIDALRRKHEKSEQQDRELQNKGL